MWDEQGVTRGIQAVSRTSCGPMGGSLSTILLLAGTTASASGCGSDTEGMVDTNAGGPGAWNAGGSTGGSGIEGEPGTGGLGAGGSTGGEATGAVPIDGRATGASVAPTRREAGRRPGAPPRPAALRKRAGRQRREAAQRKRATRRREARHRRVVPSQPGASRQRKALRQRVERRWAEQRAPVPAPEPQARHHPDAWTGSRTTRATVRSTPPPSVPAA